MESTPQLACLICCEHIDYYAIGECGHNEICWKCCLKQRYKLHKKECPYCKSVNYKVLITRNKDLRMEKAIDSIYDNDYDIYYEDLYCRNEIQRLLSFNCAFCNEGHYRRKFPTLKSLANHYEQQHDRYLCKQCLEFKPIFIFEQKLYSFGGLREHEKKHHPSCYFCQFQSFYDQEHLNKHYLNEHQFCGLCKKLGRKRNSTNSRYTNLPEYEVYRDWLELRNHYMKDHYVCDKSTELCMNLVFETGAQLAAHYLNVHGERRQVQVEFGFSDDEEEKRQAEEEKKEENAVITKDNYRDLFPTLATTNKSGQKIQPGDWPFLQNSSSSRPQTSNQTKKKKNYQEQRPYVPPSKKQLSQVHYREKIEEKKIESRVEKQDLSYQFKEDNDKVKFANVQKAPGTSQKKKTKIIVSNQRESSSSEDEVEQIKQEIRETKTQSNKKSQENNKNQYDDYPVLSQSQMKHKANESGWTKVPQYQTMNGDPVKQQIQENNTSYKVNKQQFPTLPIEKPKPKNNNKDKDKEDTVIKKKKNRKKPKGQEMDMHALDPVDYKKLF